MSNVVGWALVALTIFGYLVAVLTIPGILTRWAEALFVRRSDTPWEATVVRLRHDFGEDEPRNYSDHEHGIVPPGAA